jgi:hypothetical protein
VTELIAVTLPGTAVGASPATCVGNSTVQWVGLGPGRRRPVRQLSCDRADSCDTAWYSCRCFTCKTRRQQHSKAQQGTLWGGTWVEHTC